MSAFRAIAAALVKGFVRDKASVFFSLVFPLMFLVLFGGILTFESSPQLDLVEIGDVSVIDDLPDDAREAFEETFVVTRTEDRDQAIDDVRKGDADVAVEMNGTTVVAHFTRTDQVRAAMVRGTLGAYVDGVNQSISNVPPTYTFEAVAVEDDSLKAIQYVTPGLLGWAVAMSAAFGAAATLQGWRNSGLMRRLQLSPAPAWSVISARVVVTVGIALVQMAIFLTLGVAVFGLKLSGEWWWSIPLLVAGTLSFMALGLLAGAVAKTQEGAVNMANFLVLPMAFLSGSFFSLEGAPSWLQGISQVMPLRHLNDGMTDVLVRGQGVAAILAPMAYVLVFGLVIGTVAVLMFRRADG